MQLRALVVGLRPRELRIGLRQLLLEVILFYRRQDCALGYPVADIHVPNAPIGAPHLANADDIPTRLEGEIDLGIGLNVGRIRVGHPGFDELHLAGADGRQRALVRHSILTTARCRGHNRERESKADGRLGLRHASHSSPIAF